MTCCRIVDLRLKEVINIHDGCRLGFVNDVEVDTCCGKVVSIVVPGPSRFFGLFGREEDYVIPWDDIKRIGEDIILIECSFPGRRMYNRRERRGWNF